MTQKSMVGIFRDLNANRESARQARMKFGVFTILKNGNLSKDSVKFETEDEANKHSVSMAEWNPGKSFVVRPL